MVWVSGWEGGVAWIVMTGWRGMGEWIEGWISLEEVTIRGESRCFIPAIPSLLCTNKHNHPSLLFIASHTLEHTILRQISIQRSTFPTKRKPSLTHITGRDRRGFT